MLGLNKIELYKEIDAEETSVQKIQNELEEVRAKIADLSKQKNDLESEVTRKNRKIEYLCEQQIVADGIPGPLVGMRRLIIGGKKNLLRKDITILDHEKLEADVAECIQNLQQLCHHPFVIGYRGYEGSYSNEYADAYTGFRLCLVCGLAEYSKSHGDERFETLVESELRLVKTTGVGTWEKRIKVHIFDVWQPLEPIIKAVFCDRKIFEVIEKICSSPTPR